MIRRVTLCIAMLGAIALAGCFGDQQPQVQYAQPPQLSASDVSPAYQPQPIPQQEDHTIRDGLIGAGVGYMLGRHTAGNGGSPGIGSGGYHPPPNVVHNTVVKKVYVQQNVQQVVRPRVTTSPRFSAPSASLSRSSTYRPSFSSSPRRR